MYEFGFDSSSWTKNVDAFLDGCNVLRSDDLPSKVCIFLFTRDAQWAQLWACSRTFSWWSCPHGPILERSFVDDYLVSIIPSGTRGTTAHVFLWRVLSMIQDRRPNSWGDTKRGYCTLKVICCRHWSFLCLITRWHTPHIAPSPDFLVRCDRVHRWIANNINEYYSFTRKAIIVALLICPSSKPETVSLSVSALHNSTAKIVPMRTSLA